MRIERIELRHIRMRLRSPFETSFGVEHDRDCLIIRIQQGDLEGWGECVAGRFPWYSYETTTTAWHVLSEFFIPEVIGKDLENIVDYRRCLRGFKGHSMAKAGLELAFWDLFGKSQARSLADMLGGKKKRVPVGVSVGIQEDSNVLLEVIRGYLEAGYQRVKIKIKPGRDVADIEVLRSVFPHLPLQVDANSAYGLEDKQVFEALDRFDLLLIEQPLAEDDLIDHSRLQATLNTPICLDESIISARHARQALEIEACRVINIKAGRVGGLSEAMVIHDLCRDAGIPVWCGGMLETGIGRAANLALASMPGFRLPGDISATDRYYKEDIAGPSFTLNEDSTIDVPADPGLGIEVDLAAIDRFTVHRESFKA